MSEVLDPRVDIGHVHLKVADLDRALDFWCGVLGFEEQARMGDQAAFVSAGGYHHHIGLNTWAGEGAPSPPSGARGLRWFEILLPTPEALTEVEARVAGAGIEATRDDPGLRLSDPSGNALLLGVA
jgi:catechol 2,3-dioxygenase